MMKQKVLANLSIMALVASLIVGCGGKSATQGTGASKKDSNWPTKNVSMIVPWNAGGDSDIYCRLLAKRLQSKFNQNFVVIDMAGGSGIVGAKTVMAAKPDGYTVLFNHTGTTAIQQATKTVDFDYINDFTNAGTAIQDTTYTVVAKKKAGWKNLKDFIAYAKANPGKVRYSNVYGTITHFVGAKMEETMGIKFNMLDVGAGTSERLAAFMGDQVDVLAANYLNVRDYIEKGEFVVLGVCSDKPVPGIDKVPTFKDQGYNISYPKSYELKFPKGTDAAIADKMSKAVEEITKDAEFKKELGKYYSVPMYRNVEQTMKEDAALVEEMKKIFKVAK